MIVKIFVTLQFKIPAKQLRYICGMYFIWLNATTCFYFSFWGFEWDFFESDLPWPVSELLFYFSVHSNQIELIKFIDKILRVQCTAFGYPTNMLIIMIEKMT